MSNQVPTIITILGARPQFIKAAPLHHFIKSEGYFKEVLVHTGQHFDGLMSDVFFRDLNLDIPKYHLNINGLDREAMINQMEAALIPIIDIERPDAVLVYGDTNSTLAGALATKKLGVKLVHVEAGLRSNNLLMPEELNRIETDLKSDLLITPVVEAFDYLNSDVAFASKKIVNCGDTMLDIFQNSTSQFKVPTMLDEICLGNFFLFTLHRPSNTDSEVQLMDIVQSLNKIAAHHVIVWPLHPRIKHIGSASLHPNICCVAPLGYLELMGVLEKCQLVITDSGGLQREAYFAKKPSVILRSESEWKSLITHGYGKLTTAASLESDVAAQLNFSGTYDENFFGDGNAAKRIHRALVDFLK